MLGKISAILEASITSIPPELVVPVTTGDVPGS
jgi:hypothetical protein